MERLKVIQLGESKSPRPIKLEGKPDPLTRFKAVTKDLTEKALEIVNKISIDEMNKTEPRKALLEDYYLLFHYLDFLRRFASSQT